MTTYYNIQSEVSCKHPILQTNANVNYVINKPIGSDDLSINKYILVNMHFGQLVKNVDIYLFNNLFVYLILC